jgi:hypothetical protein
MVANGTHAARGGHTFVVGCDSIKGTGSEQLLEGVTQGPRRAVSC